MTEQNASMLDGSFDSLSKHLCRKAFCQGRQQKGRRESVKYRMCGSSRQQEQPRQIWGLGYGVGIAKLQRNGSENMVWPAHGQGCPVQGWALNVEIQSRCIPKRPSPLGIIWEELRELHRPTNSSPSAPRMWHFPYFAAGQRKNMRTEGFICVLSAEYWDKHTKKKLNQRVHLPRQIFFPVTDFPVHLQVIWAMRLLNPLGIVNRGDLTTNLLIYDGRVLLFLGWVHKFPCLCAADFFVAGM